MFKKQFKLSEKIPDTSLFIPFLIAVPLILWFCFKNIWICLIALGLLLFIYLRSGKIKPYNGEIIFVFGLPRSGKTMLLAKIAHDNIKNCYIAVNEELQHFYEKDAVIQRSDIGKYKFGDENKSGIILYDEVSFDGFDNRDFKTNFKGEEGKAILKGFKKSGHRYQSVVLANQGWNEVDSKIREGVCHSAYWVKDRGSYSVAIKLPKDIEIDNTTGQPRDTYLRPSFIQRLIDPSCYVYIRHKKYGKYFDTHFDEGLPLYPYSGAPEASGAPDQFKPDIKQLDEALKTLKEMSDKINASESDNI